MYAKYGLRHKSVYALVHNHLPTYPANTYLRLGKTVGIIVRFELVTSA